MMDRRSEISEYQLEAYLDGQMTGDEREQFEKLVEGNPDVAQTVSLETRIDAALGRLFPPREPVSPHQIEAWIPNSSEVSPKEAKPARPADSRRSLGIAILAALAAMVAWAMVAWQFSGDEGREPFFEPRPLADIYRETVRNGFQPYYNCSDEERFAETFQARQEQPLMLGQLPAGSGMLGLSYSGGLSRDTTAVLCQVNERPVIVFVDRLAVDKPVAIENTGEDLHVLRSELAGLVMYEVTPFEQPVISKYLRLPEK